ncbi:hypothetical protein Tco_0585382 [Tanacetum coccineum]
MDNEGKCVKNERHNNVEEPMSWMGRQGTKRRQREITCRTTNGYERGRKGSNSKFKIQNSKFKFNGMESVKLQEEGLIKRLPIRHVLLGDQGEETRVSLEWRPSKVRRDGRECGLTVECGPNKNCEEIQTLNSKIQMLSSLLRHQY